MISQFIDSLPDKVRCTDNFENGTKHRKKVDALTYPYIEHNQLYKKYIVLDIDKPESAFLWEDFRLPAPTFTVINPKNAHCHYLWALKTPVIYTEAGRRKPQLYYENTDSALTRLLPGADPAYVGKFTKNPLSPYWKTIHHDVEYDLGDFGEYLDITPIRKQASLLWDAQGRNCTLFNNTRFWAYAKVKTYLDYYAFQQAVELKAYEINAQFISQSNNGSLNYKEVLSTAKSIGKWTWNHRFGKLKCKGIMNLPDYMPQKEKEVLGAFYSHQQRKETVIEKIMNAAKALQTQGIPITQKSVAIRSDVSIPTIKRNWKMIEQQFNLYA